MKTGLRVSAVAILVLLGLASAAVAPAAEDRIDFDLLRARARALAAAPYVAPPDVLPPWLKDLAYTAYRGIEFDPARALWRGERGLFKVSFFHPGGINRDLVRVYELRDGRPSLVPFQSAAFNYGSLQKGPIPDPLQYAGFRIHYPLTQPNDELGGFQGASYYRFLGRGTHYGLSARGIALNTAEPDPDREEFPRFTDFWIERPGIREKKITVYALLDGPSVSGAYRFLIEPGNDTVLEVKMALYFRRVPKVLGLAPLTSMYWRGENSGERGEDFRPEVHDSDGLLVNNGAGEWVWRPLTHIGIIRRMAFADDNPRGFGLMQRDRAFANYEDLEAWYHIRPSVWIEPIGKWGRGSVRLIELPTKDEYADNMVAFWTPEDIPPPGTPLELEYRQHWALEPVKPALGFVTATRVGRSVADRPDLVRFVVDFSGPRLLALGASAPDSPALVVGPGAKLDHVSLTKNPVNGTWRVVFAIQPDDSRRPVELRCHLSQGDRALTETWSYLWNP